jgi:hypothetical protein
MSDRSHYAVTVPGASRRDLDALAVALGSSRTALVVRGLEVLEASLLPAERTRVAEAKRLLAQR